MLSKATVLLYLLGGRNFYVFGQMLSRSIKVPLDQIVLLCKSSFNQLKIIEDGLYVEYGTKWR